MDDISLTGLAIVVAVAFAVPLLLGFAPGLRVPAVVLEIVAGIIIGPHVLGLVTVDEPILIFSMIGLAFLLFLAGMEIDIRQLQVPMLRIVGLGFVASFGLALLVTHGMAAVGLGEGPLLVAVILVATSLGMIVPLLKDAGELASPFGQLVITGGTVAEFGAILLLSLLFSGQTDSTHAQLILMASFVAVTAVVFLSLMRAERWQHLNTTIRRLSDTSAQLRVRGAVVLLLGFVVAAHHFALEGILGAFMAGVILSIIGRDALERDPSFRHKLEGIGFGVFVPIFFVASGVQFDLAAFADRTTVLHVPAFLAALLLVRGLPALLYRPLVSDRHTVVAGLLQATSLPFIVAGSAIGVEFGQISTETAAALVAAGLLSTILFPLLALTLLPRGMVPPSPMEGEALVEEPSG